MKKIALLLALLMLVTAVLAACGGGEESGTTESTESAESVPGEESKETSKDPKETSGDPVKPISETAQFETNVALGCSYTAAPGPASQYEDTYSCEMTDGLFASDPSYGDSAFCGFEPEGVLVLVIDLGKVQEKIYRFQMSYLNTSEAGIAAPSGCRVDYSEDNKEWKTAGLAKRPATSEPNTVQRMTCDLTEYVSARYVRFTVSKGSHWMFMDEFLVIADIEGVDASSEYVKKMIATYGEEKMDYEQRVKLLSSAKGAAIDRAKTRYEVNKGRNYTLSQQTVAGFEDEGFKLSDGVVSGYLESGAWLAFAGGKDVEVLYDLGKVRDDLAEFEVSAYANGTTSAFPTYVSVEVGDDKSSFVEIGRAYGPAGKQNAYTFLLTLPHAVHGRYVKFVLHSGAENKQTQIEECGIYVYGEEPETVELYPSVVLPKVKEDSFWPSSSKDYGKNTDLLAGLHPQIEAAAPQASKKEYNTDPSSPVMTDGKYAVTNQIHGGEYFKFNACGSRNIYFDLGYLSELSEVKASFLSFVPWGVYLPTDFSVSLSDDATNWYYVGSIDFSGGEDQKATVKTLKFEKKYAARFVRFSFTTNGWMATDEIEVIGNKKVSSSAVRLKDSGITKETISRGAYVKPSENLLGGSRDICLMYYGQGFDYDETEMLPYVAYLDTEGNIKDTMFDGYLFLLSRTFPSGVAGHEGSIKSDWEWTLDRYFAKGLNFEALNNTVGKVNEALGTPDRKVNVFVSIYYLRPEVKSFGDVDGDGVSENMSVLEDRFKVIRWFMESFEKRFAEAGFENLNFGGYYWYHESIPGETEDADSRNYITGTAKIAHERGKQLFWIPYYGATGYTDWAKFDLDVACFQPNYAFHADVLESRLNNAASTAKNLNMCIELEIDEKAFTVPVYFEKYMDYMKHSVSDGYVDTIHMYYQGVSSIMNACNSQNPRLRLIYEYTYQLIKRTLQVKPEAMDAVSANAEKDTPFAGKLVEQCEETQRFHLVRSPEHGTVSVMEDGTFMYYPDHGFTGEDSFAFVYDRYLEDSDPIECKITVK